MGPLGVYLTSYNLVPASLNPESITLYNQRLVQESVTAALWLILEVTAYIIQLPLKSEGAVRSPFQRPSVFSQSSFSCQNWQARAKEEVGLHWSPFYIPSFNHSAFCNVRRHIYRDVRLFPTQPSSAPYLLPVLFQGKYVDEALSHLGTMSFKGFSTDFTLCIYPKTYIK